MSFNLIYTWQKSQSLYICLYLSLWFSFFKNEPISASFSFIFVFFLRDTIQIQFDLSIDSVLGTRTRVGRMGGADKSTELWRHPNLFLFLYTYAFSGIPMPFLVHLCLFLYTFAYSCTPMPFLVHLCLFLYTYAFSCTYAFCCTAVSFLVHLCLFMYDSTSYSGENIILSEVICSGNLSKTTIRWGK